MLHQTKVTWYSEKKSSQMDWRKHNNQMQWMTLENIVTKYVFFLCNKFIGLHLFMLIHVSVCFRYLTWLLVLHIVHRCNHRNCCCNVLIWWNNFLIKSHFPNEIRLPECVLIIMQFIENAWVQLLKIGSEAKGRQMESQYSWWLMRNQIEANCV